MKSQNPLVYFFRFLWCFNESNLPKKLLASCFFSVQKSFHTTHENYEKIMCIAILRGQFGRTPTALGLLQSELIILVLFKTIFTNYLVDAARYGGNLERNRILWKFKDFFCFGKPIYFLSEISVKHPIKKVLDICNSLLII